jgi:predicted nucleic acid-binding protein
MTVLAQADTAGIVGGAVYDALIAATSREAGAALVSLDQRAARVYRALGVEHTLLA